MTPAHQIAEKLTADWLANTYEIHKRPPYRAYSFNSDGRYWVVGSTMVSVLHGVHGPKEWADALAAVLNGTSAVREILLSKDQEHD